MFIITQNFVIPNFTTANNAMIEIYRENFVVVSSR
jgi:hypothetical protein